MKAIYLREPERPFKLWKWLLFGPLFILALDYAAFQLDFVDLLQVSCVLGVLIVVRMIGIRELAWGARVGGGLGLVLAISLIASLDLLGFCTARPSVELCAPHHFGALVLGNFAFPLIAVVVWAVVVMIGGFGKTVKYVIRYWKR